MKVTKMILLGALLTLAETPSFAADDGRACTTAKKYIELLQMGDFEGVGKLWAKDSVFNTPLGTQLRGQAAIADYYKTRIAAAKLILRGQNYIGNDSECYLEIWHRSSPNADGKYVTDPNGEFHRGAADHFFVDPQGLVVEMVAYPAPTALPLGGAAVK